MVFTRRNLILTSFAFVTSYGFAESQHVPASSIPEADLYQPGDFAAALRTDGPKPVILQVGSQVLFAQAHVAGSEYAGPAGQQGGLQLLKDRIATLPKSTVVVLYCGCCPWSRCPNIAPAYRLLREQGFNQVKVVSIANNFGDDWAAKGYPTEKGR